ncbi:hypothetical protein FB559_8072 [Actinoallomurus bryophytorum]|uniref:Uncharacterized protein n=1 Tax=Actinoallomurus bryophytorum TaxID=1490222 RepID=A0A543C0Z5_9ACTN|nr:hypothetical protein FB559_8072 [Actinoallomurus bryophytorum]
MRRLTLARTRAALPAVGVTLVGGGPPQPDTTH